MSTDWKTADKLADAFDKASEGDSGDAEFSAAYELAEFVHAAAKRDAKPPLHGAIIEWPDDLAHEPTLVLTQNQDDVDDLIRDAIKEMVTAIASESTIMLAFREAFTQDPSDWQAHLFLYDGPFVTRFTKEI